MATFQLLDIENVGQGHLLPHSQSRRNSMSNVKPYKSHNAHCSPRALTVSKMLTFQMFDLENLGQGHRV